MAHNELKVLGEIAYEGFHSTLELDEYAPFAELSAEDQQRWITAGVNASVAGHHKGELNMCDWYNDIRASKATIRKRRREQLKAEAALRLKDDRWELNGTLKFIIPLAIAVVYSWYKLASAVPELELRLTWFIVLWLTFALGDHYRRWVQKQPPQKEVQAVEQISG